MIEKLIFGIVTIFVVVIMKISIYPSHNEQMKIAIIQNSTTTSTITSLKLMTDMFPVVFVIVIITTILGVVVSTVKGFSDYSSDYEEENEDVAEEEKPHKQTYLEYVKERLAVERLMRRGG